MKNEETPIIDGDLSNQVKTLKILIYELSSGT
jgi:hypothetical protein